MQKKRIGKVVFALLLAFCLVQNVGVSADEAEAPAPAENAETTKQNIIVQIGDPKEGTETSFATVQNLPKGVDAILTITKEGGDGKPMVLISDGGNFTDLSEILGTDQISAVKFEGNASYNVKVSFKYAGQSSDLMKEKMDGVKLVLNGDEQTIDVNGIDGTVATTVSKVATPSPEEPAPEEPAPEEPTPGEPAPEPAKQNLVMKIGIPEEGTDTSFVTVQNLPKGVSAVLTIKKDGSDAKPMALISDGENFTDLSIKEGTERLSAVSFEGGAKYIIQVSFLYGGGNPDLLKQKLNGVALDLNDAEYEIKIVNDYLAMVEQGFHTVANESLETLQKNKAKAEVAKAAEEKRAEIEKSDLTEEEKREKSEAVQQALDTATKAIEAADTQEKVEEALQAGLQAIQKIELKSAPKPEDPKPEDPKPGDKKEDPKTPNPADKKDSTTTADSQKDDATTKTEPANNADAQKDDTTKTEPAAPTNDADSKKDDTTTKTEPVKNPDSKKNDATKKTDAPKKADAKKANVAPKTGDDRSILLYGVLAAAAVVAFAIVAREKKFLK